MGEHHVHNVKTGMVLLLTNVSLLNSLANKWFNLTTNSISFFRKDYCKVRKNYLFEKKPFSCLLLASSPLWKAVCDMLGILVFSRFGYYCPLEVELTAYLLL